MGVGERDGDERPRRVAFDLRPMERGDGPAIAALLSSEAPTTALAMTTHYRHDIYDSMLAQHPDTFGVVATTPGVDGLVGLATAFIEGVQVEGRMLPAARLENLKVHHGFRRLGLGRRLAEWRIAEAKRRFDDHGLVTAGVDATNAASLATARHWATQVIGPLQVRIATTMSKRPAGPNRVRPIEGSETDEVVDAVNAFYAGFNLFPRQTPTRFREALGPTALTGSPIRHYRVVVTPGGAIIAGGCVTERFALMSDHLERIPTPLALLARVVPLIPPGGVIRSIEVGLGWHAPGQASAGRQLWDAIRHEWHGRATHVAGLASPGTELAAMYHVGLSLQPRVKLMVPVQSPVPLDPARPVYLWR